MRATRRKFVAVQSKGWVGGRNLQSEAWLRQPGDRQRFPWQVNITPCTGGVHSGIVRHPESDVKSFLTRRPRGGYDILVTPEGASGLEALFCGGDTAAEGCAVAQASTPVAAAAAEAAMAELAVLAKRQKEMQEQEQEQERTQEQHKQEHNGRRQGLQEQARLEGKASPNSYDAGEDFIPMGDASVGDDDSAGDEASEQAAAQQEISDVDSAQDFIAMFE